ncbi:lamin tail domain-containing protein [Haloferula sargassicola]|uniref:LTD domain-containing protein n=1 Tax=Haloferula sargassicola TaxID=490096 RepID=A0ABP9UIR7_9BACT
MLPRSGAQPMIYPNARVVLLFAGLTITPVPADVRISEFLAANDSIVVPGQADAGFHDWIELENTGPAAVDLAGWHLTDRADSPTKWTFSAGSVIAAGGFLVVLADGSGVPETDGLPRTNFALGASGEYVALSDPSAAVVSEFGPAGTDYPPQVADVSYGLDPTSGAAVFFGTPTPGAANSSDIRLVGAVGFSHQRGFFTSPFQVVLETPDPGAQIRYTLDGRPPIDAAGTPVAGSIAYSGPIPIASTSVLRAAAIREGATPSAVATQTYVFPAAVASQVRPTGYPTTWGEESHADYAVDPDISQSATDGQRFLAGLRDLPTISVCADMEDLFGSTGLYADPLGDQEKAVSAEYFEPLESGDGANGPVAFQINCGLRMQGGASREPGKAIKHSFSLRFRAEYGPGRLRADLFPPPAAGSFDSLHLRANYNNSWIHPDANQRQRANQFTDQWMRDSFIAMGHADGCAGRYVHLFLNGLYWGVYNLHERVDADHYADYSNYNSEDVTSYHPGNHSAAEQASFEAMKAAVAGGDWEEIQARLDVDSYIDFYIAQHFGHNDDLKPTDNWRAAGGGPAQAPWRFYLWDSERCLEDPGDTGSLAVSQDGAGLFDELSELPGFRLRFADRAYRHLHHDGALTNPRNRLKVLDRVDELDRAIVGESARWGDDRSGGDGPDGDFTRADNWLPAIFGPLDTEPHHGLLGAGGWFPETGENRTEILIAAWKNHTWPGSSETYLPAVDPPQFFVDGLPQHGGRLPAGSALTAAGSTARRIYLTTDGSDPRAPDGTLQPGLTPYNGTPITPQREGIVKARWFTGAQWSALNEARFATDRLAGPGDLVVSEISYHPADPDGAEILAASGLPGAPNLSDDDFEFIEVLNVGGDSVNLDGCRFADGIDFVFPPYTLAPGERVVVAEDLRMLPLRFPASIPPAGQWSGALDNGGEAITLVDADGNLIDDFRYDDEAPWPTEPDGGGPSLNRLGIGSDGHLAISWLADAASPGSGWVQDRFASWSQRFGLSGPDDDSDGDGIPALVEYGLLLDPAAPDPAPTFLVENRSFTIFRDPGRSDVAVTILGSENLETWEPAGNAVTPLQPNLERVQAIAPESADRYFFRAQVQETP